MTHNIKYRIFNKLHNKQNKRQISIMLKKIKLKLVAIKAIFYLILVIITNKNDNTLIKEVKKRQQYNKFLVNQI